MTMSDAVAVGRTAKDGMGLSAIRASLGVKRVVAIMVSLHVLYQFSPEMVSGFKLRSRRFNHVSTLEFYLLTMKTARSPHWISVPNFFLCWYAWPMLVPVRSKVRVCGRSIAGMRVRIPPRCWMPVCCGCCVLWGTGFCDEPITHLE
jgi:hypothetical protein